MNDLPDPIVFFSVMAQVSFTITGLIVIAVASDPLTRKFWYGSPDRTAFSNTSLILLLLPGVLSVGSLLPAIPNTVVPVWPFAVGLCAIFYLLVAAVAGSGKPKTQNQTNEFKQLERLTYYPKLFALFYGLGLLIIGCFAYLTYWTLDPVKITLVIVGAGTTLLSILIVNVLNIASMFRAIEKWDSTFDSKPIETSDNPLVSVSVTSIDKERHSSGIGFLILATLFIIGVLVTRKKYG